MNIIELNLEQVASVIISLKIIDIIKQCNYWTYKEE